MYTHNETVEVMRNIFRSSNENTNEIFVDDLSVSDEFDRWASEEVKDIFQPEKISDIHEFDYAWNDLISSDQILMFVD